MGEGEGRRIPARIIVTGVELILEEEFEIPPDPPELAAPFSLTPEDRAIRQRVERGEVIEVRAQEFVDFETGEGRVRWRGGSLGLPIDVTRDPTVELLALAQGDVRENGPFGDLRRSGFDVTRWEYYAAPHRLELSEHLRERLAGAWKERPPRGGL
jgi:hypothetical protein